MEGIADYELVRSLGGGDRGSVFVAKPPARLHLDVDLVAVKVLSAPQADDARRRLTRELRLFATVQSPLLVMLYDAGQDGERFYYAMPYYPGGSLAAPDADLSRRQRAKAVADAARAAHALHEHGVVHRGIKPSNILLTGDGGVLGDLGLAQALSPGQTVTGIGAVASVEYLDPSVLLGQTASRASDVWSLGMTLHRVLTGQGAFGELPERDPLVAVRTILTTRPVMADDLSPDERTVIERALAPEAVDRQPTALELAAEIDALA